MAHDHTRDPCPWIILHDLGSGIAVGAICGGIWHGVKGARNSPRGGRFVGAIASIKARAPVAGGQFGAWRGTFSAFECAVQGWRQREDPWNAVISGFMTGGTLALRDGPRAAFASAVSCGIVVSVFEGVFVLFDRAFNKGPRPLAYESTP